MADGARQLAEMIAKLRAIGEMPTQAAPRVAQALEAELLGNIAAGRGPDGQAWQLKADGGKPLATAGKSLRVRAVGPVVVASIAGAVVRHHLGTARGHIVRRILPSRRMSTPAVAAIKRVLAEHWHKAMR